MQDNCGCAMSACDRIYFELKGLDEMAIRRVSNQIQLDSALGAAEDGDTILLSSGTYSRLTMNTGRGQDYNFDRKVTIASENKSNPAVVRELYINNASNVEFKNIDFDYTGFDTPSTPDILSRTHFLLTNIKDVSIVDSEFDGHIRNGYGVSWGLRVRDADGFELSGSTFANFEHALGIYNSADVVIEGNEIRGLSGNGMFLGGLDGVTIENNISHDYNSATPSALHQDHIQFYSTAKIPASRDVVIRNNTMESSDNRHAIFMGNELYTASGNKSAFHRNVLIEDNDIRTANHHGVAVIHADGLVIRDNDIETYSSSSPQTPVISVSVLSRNVKILDNNVASVPVAQNGTWTVSGNDTDSGAKNVKHHYWVIDGTKIATKTSTNTNTSTDDDDTSGGDTGGGDTDAQYVVRLDGRNLDGEENFAVRGVDFGQGDVFVFSNFDNGTFVSDYGGNPIWHRSNYSAVTIKSALDLQELAAVSSKVSAWTSGDDLVVKVDKNGGDAARVVFEDMAQDFRDADQPWLF